MTNFSDLVDAVINEDIRADFDLAARAKAESDLANWAMNNRQTILACVEWRNLAERAISLVEDAVKDTDWGQPTFGPDYGEELRAEYDALAKGEQA